MKAAIAMSCCAALLLVAVPAFAQLGNLNEQDKSFIKATLDANLAQQKLGDLAQHQAQSPTVKAFGQWISADDQFANKRLQKLAGEIGDHQQPELTVKSQAAEKDLQNVKGAQFDQKCMKAEKQAIEKSVALFTSEEKSCRTTSSRISLRALPRSWKLTSTWRKRCRPTCQWPRRSMRSLRPPPARPRRRSRP